MTQHPIENQPQSPEKALFAGQIQGLVATFFQNERPPRGLAGRLDWYFHGAISTQLQNGTISGAAGECVYLPIQRNNSIYHILLLGCGETQMPSRRHSVSRSSLEILKKNLLSLQWKSVGISHSDFGKPVEKDLETSLEGVRLWITT